MSSKDLLEKLFDVEHEAEDIVSQAREEAGKRLDAARNEAKKHYTDAYDAAMSRALAAREQSDRSARDEYEKELASYRSRLESSRLDLAALAAACESALEEGL